MVNKHQFMKHNQNKFRQDLLFGLEDVVTEGKTNPDAIGRRYILQSSFYGGQRHVPELSRCHKYLHITGAT